LQTTFFPCPTIAGKTIALVTTNTRSQSLRTHAKSVDAGFLPASGIAVSAASMASNPEHPATRNNNNLSGRQIHARIWMAPTISSLLASPVNVS
jgi:hypothetical protein